MIIKRKVEVIDQSLKDKLTAEELDKLEQANEERVKSLNEQDEIMLDTPLFKEDFDSHRRNDKIKIKIKDDISKMNNMPCINDDLKFFARSLEVQSIVS